MANLKIYSVETSVSFLKTEEIVILPRDKNTNFKHIAGTTFDEEIDFLKKYIMPCHCFEGPVPDKNPKFPEMIYKFKALYMEKYWVYIKGKVIELDGGKRIKILSFHKDNQK